MNNQREFTSIEVSKALQALEIELPSTEYFWQTIQNRGLVDPNQGTYVLGDPTYFVGPAIQQGPSIIYQHVEQICPAYTFTQLFEWLKTAWTSLPDSSSPADQIARYIILTRKK